MDEKYNEAIDLYLAGRYAEAIETMAKSKTVAPDAFQEFVKQCRKLDPHMEVKDQTDINQANEEIQLKEQPGVSVPNSFAKQKKMMILNVVIGILIAVNLTISVLWIKGCISPQSVMNNDMDRVSELEKKRNLKTQNDSVSYAEGCYIAQIWLSDPNNQLYSYDELGRRKIYAGMYQGMKSPFDEIQYSNILLGLQHTVNTEIESHWTAGKLEGDAIFQGIYDVAITGRNTIISAEECGSILRNSVN